MRKKKFEIDENVFIFLAGVVCSLIIIIFLKEAMPISHQKILITESNNEVCVKDVHFSYTLGKSMDPTIGSSVFYSDYNGEDLNPGDIISFKSDDISIVHRIIEVNDNYLITKGDNNKFADERISKNSVEGIVKCTCFN